MRRSLVLCVVLGAVFFSASFAVAQTPTPSPTPTPAPPEFDNQSLFPVGAVVMWTAAAAPDGWLFLNGQCVSASSYPALLSVIEHTVSPACSAGEFRLPDMRGRFPRGVNEDYGSLSPLDFDDSGGFETQTLTIGEMPTHSHSIRQNNLSEVWGGVQSGNPSRPLAPNYSSVSNPGYVVTTGDTGDGDAFNQMNPYRVLYFIIWSGVPTLDLPASECTDCGGGAVMLPGADYGIDLFNFHNMFVPLAFVVSGFLVVMRLQWQAFFYFLAVAYGVQDLNQFAFVSIVLVAQVLYSKLHTASTRA